MATKNIPRNEYPRPTWTRNDWQCLNGTWDFAIAPEDSAPDKIVFDKKIVVPFAPESVLSGIGKTDFMECVWYRRTLSFPKAWKGKEVLLHFQAVDYDTTIWLDGEKAMYHRGCFTPITVRIPAKHPASMELVLRASTLRYRNRPRGKQSDRPENYDCVYTRTTGIWQTVWMEPVDEWHLKRPRITPTANGFTVEAPVTANRKGTVCVAVRPHKTKCKPLAAAEAPTELTLTPTIPISLKAKDLHLWSIETPYLYDLEITLKDEKGNVRDCATAVSGIRFITINGTQFIINGKPVFQRLVLDQGFYRDGIWTAPSDAALVRDIKLSQKAGFNGARLHQKVFEERFLYHADCMGYICWGEFGDWGWDWNEGELTPAGAYQPGLSLVEQWQHVLERDYNHPAIIGWCPLNETHIRKCANESSMKLLDDLTNATYFAAKNADRTRPVLDASGYIHLVHDADIYDIHDYSQPDEIDKRLPTLKQPCICDIYGEAPRNIPWMGQPFFLSEIGGIGWPYRPGDFSYGPPPKSTDEVLARIDALLKAIQRQKFIFGYCYTQLTDVFQENNGIFTFDREEKFSLAKLRKIQQRIAAYER